MAAASIRQAEHCASQPCSMPMLGRVDGFDQDEHASDRDEGSEVLCGLLAAQGDPFEALDLADTLFDAGASLVEDAGKEIGFCGSVLAVRNGGAESAPARRPTSRPRLASPFPDDRPL